jgi:hypothetical protein
LSPPLPFYILFILTGVWSLARDVGGIVSKWLGKPADWCSGRLAELRGWSLDQAQSGRANSRSICQAVVLILFTAVALFSTLNAWDLSLDHGPDRPAPEMAWFELELLYARAADVVLAHAEDGETLCAGDIGTLGYITGMPIVDTVGLVTPESRRYYPADPDIYVTNYAIPADLVLALDPDFIVILEVYGRRGLLPDPGFQARYRLLKALETDIYGSDGMLIYRRVSSG